MNVGNLPSRLGAEGSAIRRGQSGAAITILSYTPVDPRGTLVGFADVRINHWYQRLLGCAVHVHQNDSRWVQLPARPMLDQNGNVLRGENGNYAPSVEFDDRDKLRRFSAAVIEALGFYAPGWDRRSP